MENTPAQNTPTVHLLVDGNVNVGKDKGSGQLLLTGTSLFALRTHVGATAMGAATGGLIGVLIGSIIDKRRAKKREPSEHLADPEVAGLPEKSLKKIRGSTQLVKVPLDDTLSIKRTKMGYQFTLLGEEEPLVVYQGFGNKKKIANHLAQLGLHEA